MDVLLKYFENLEEVQISQFEKLKPLYLNWNEKINVISRSDIQHLYEHHVLHSLAIAKIFKFDADTSILDVGTGGGFPGIPLAILFPKVQFQLIDSIGKKIKVVVSVAEELGLKNISANHVRVQEMHEKFDFIVSRAVTNLPEFMNITKNLIRNNIHNPFKNGILYLKGGEFQDELNLIRSNYKIYNLSDYFDEPFFNTKKLIHLYS